MAERSDVMVLRSINLPADMDEQLRGIAFVLRRPKADLIRYFINRGLAELTQRMGPRPSEETLEQLSNQVAAGGGSTVERDGIEADLSQVQRILAGARR